MLYYTTYHTVTYHAVTSHTPYHMVYIMWYIIPHHRPYHTPHHILNHTTCHTTYDVIPLISYSTFHAIPLHIQYHAIPHPTAYTIIYYTISYAVIPCHSLEHFSLNCSGLQAEDQVPHLRAQEGRRGVEGGGRRQFEAGSWGEPAGWGGTAEGEEGPQGPDQGTTAVPPGRNQRTANGRNTFRWIVRNYQLILGLLFYSNVLFSCFILSNVHSVWLFGKYLYLFFFVILLYLFIY